MTASRLSSVPVGKLESSRKYTLIIGGSGGLGQALSRRFLASGDRVGVHYYRNRKGAEALLQSLGFSANHERALVCGADIRNAPSVRELFRELRKRWPRLDILINSGGTTHDRLFANMAQETWRDSVAINLTGPFLCMKYAAQWMMSGGCGHVINVASLAGLAGRIGQANYAASKAGLIALTRTAAREWGAEGIQVNAVLPGLLATSMTESVPGKRREALFRENILKHGSETDEVARFVWNLSRMRSVSGQLFNLDSRLF